MLSEVDPETLLEWLQMGTGEERDMQLIALEQLCMLLLMADNVDRCFESCPPRTFLPALCRIFTDATAPDNVLEVTARAITYYLDVSSECTRRITAEDGALRAICGRLVVVPAEEGGEYRTSKDLAEQCIKVLELICSREAAAVFEAGGLTSVLSLIKDNGSKVHKDTLHSAMAVVSKLCGKMEPADPNLPACVASLSTLLRHEDAQVSECALRCFASLADRFTRRGQDPAPLATANLLSHLLHKLGAAGGGAESSVSSEGVEAGPASSSASPPTAPAATAGASGKVAAASIATVISLLSTLCRGSHTITQRLVRSSLLSALERALTGEERVVLDTMRLVDLLLVLLCDGRTALARPQQGAAGCSGSSSSSSSSSKGLRRLDSAGEKTHRQLIDCIRSKDTDALIDAINSGGFEVNFMDDVGQTLLNWASAFGTQEMVEFLCERAADVNKGQRSSSLHYAACFGRPAIAKVLLRHGANPDLRDEDGKTALDKARERNDEGHREVAAILQSPSDWIIIIPPQQDVTATTSGTASSPQISATAAAEISKTPDASSSAVEASSSSTGVTLSGSSDNPSTSSSGTINSSNIATQAIREEEPAAEGASIDTGAVNTSIASITEENRRVSIEDSINSSTITGASQSSSSIDIVSKPPKPSSAATISTSEVSPPSSSKADAAVTTSSAESSGPVLTGDAEMAPTYLRRLLPMFCHTYQSSMVHSVKRAALSLLRKILYYIPAPLLEQVIDA